MDQKSLLQIIKSLEQSTRQALSGVDVAVASMDEQKAIEAFKRLIVDAKLDVREYEYSETRMHQLESKTQASKTLDELEKSLLVVSGFGYFSPIDVAHMSATIEQLKERLE